MPDLKPIFRRVFLALQIGLSIFFLVWIWQMLENADVSGIFSDANFSLVLIALLLLPVGWILRAWRYKVLLEAHVPQSSQYIRIWPCIEGFALFLAGNAALPLRGGEWMRIAHIKSQFPKLSPAYLIGVSGTEKLPEFGYAILVIGIWLTLGPLDVILFITCIAISFVFLALVIAAIVRKKPNIERLRKLLKLDRMAIRFPKSKQILSDSLGSLSALGSFHSTLKIAAATLSVRALDSIVMLTLASALSIELSANASILIGATISLGLIVSALPAHIGVFQASTIAGATLATMDHTDALAFSVGFHGVVLTGWIAAAVASLAIIQRIISEKGRPT